jgi:hypothetical protein
MASSTLCCLWLGLWSPRGPEPDLDCHGDFYTAIGVATHGLAAHHGLEHLPEAPLAQSAVPVGCDEGFVHLHLFPVDLSGEQRFGPSAQALDPLILDGVHKLCWGLAPLPCDSVWKPCEGYLVLIENKITCVGKVELLRHFDQKSWLLTTVDDSVLVVGAAQGSGLLSVGLGAKHQHQFTPSKLLGNFLADTFGIVHINNNAHN